MREGSRREADTAADGNLKQWISIVQCSKQHRQYDITVALFDCTRFNRPVLNKKRRVEIKEIEQVCYVVLQIHQSDHPPSP